MTFSKFLVLNLVHLVKKTSLKLNEQIQSFESLTTVVGCIAFNNRCSSETSSWLFLMNIRRAWLFYHQLFISQITAAITFYWDACRRQKPLFRYLSAYIIAKKT